MEMDYTAARGFAQESPGGWIFEIGNGSLTRRIQVIGGRIGTTSLIHNTNAEEYLEETLEEFAVELTRGAQKLTLSFREFAYTGHETPKWDDEERIIRVHLEAELEGTKLPLTLCYRALGGADYISKWIEIGKSDSDWTVESITIEAMRLKEMVEGVSPISRYPGQFPSGEDDVHTDPHLASTENPKSRFAFTERSRSVLTYWGFNEGFYFFTCDLLGVESFDSGKGLVMRARRFAPASEGLVTGEAVIGAYAGEPEIAFKRYREFLSKNWCVMRGKSVPVEWNSWFVTRSGGRPVLTDCERYVILEQLPAICEAGFYDALHLDLGWEGGKPLTPDEGKFPNGLDEIVRKASECGLDMAYWINPFSSNYWKSTIEEEHPEWLNPAKISGQSGAHAICPMTGYFDFVRERLVELAERRNARLILWDGSDWNIPYCTGTEHDHTSQGEFEVRAMLRLAELAQSVHEARPDAIIAAFSLPADNHRLGVLDQQQVSDTYAFPTGQAELLQRQQMYQMTWEHPYETIRSSWHGVSWHEASAVDMKERSLRELKTAVMSMIGNGANQAAGSIDLASARPEFVEFLKKLFAWRKRFERYFGVYQHVLGFPDGEAIDGEAHFIDGVGFIVLVNPKDEPQAIDLPLSEPELELPTDKAVSVYDWSDFENGRFLGRAKVGKEFEVELAGLEVRIIGVDVSESEAV